jgi:hypothetical protein
VFPVVVHPQLLGEDQVTECILMSLVVEALRKCCRSGRHHFHLVGENVGVVEEKHQGSWSNNPFDIFRLVRSPS